ncbi:GntR family transcriptional regulator [Tichowtungia aerotolerans]|uniref:GntR family transcriptional regulator n=1 Tax=Tichowtungia aerotolerans TaxID=2697043 RepID=A0A6P1M9C7_9BACT|nr:GntR family transcriptional regulator [Tichowtungia aerotolerans]QHI69154.1 GntR family transcriptional regulator [Tichowtungia aerotolerans]
MLPSKIYSKSEQVRNLLIEGIESGQFNEKDLIPSENVLTEKFGISRNTIREAVAALVNEGILTRIQGKGTFVQEGARDLLATREIRSFCLVGCEHSVSYSLGGFMSTMVLGMHAVLDELSIPVRVVNLGAGDSLLSYLQKPGRSLEQLECSGVLFAGYQCSEDELNLLEESGIRCVSVGPQQADSRMSFADEDHEFGAYLAIQHLTEQGHRRIAMVDSEVYSAFGRRKKGAEKALRDAGISISQPWNFPVSERFSVEEVMDEILEKVPDISGLVIYPGIVPVFYRELERRKKLIPDEISLVGCMTSEHPADIIQATEVRQSLREVSKEATRLLLDAVSGKTKSCQKKIVKPELVIGETSGPVTKK